MQNTIIPNQDIFETLNSTRQNKRDYIAMSLWPDIPGTKITITAREFWSSTLPAPTTIMFVRKPPYGCNYSILIDPDVLNMSESGFLKGVHMGRLGRYLIDLPFPLFTIVPFFNISLMVLTASDLFIPSSFSSSLRVNSSFSSMNLKLVKSIGQLFCRRSLSLDLSDVF